MSAKKELLDKQLVITDFNRAAETYDSYADVQRTVASKVAALATSVFAEDDLLLDIGAGTGFLATSMQGYRMVQMDIAYAMCQKCCHLHPTVNADMDMLPFAEESFRGIVSSLTLQWTNHHAGVFAEAARVLSSGSKIVIATFGPHTLHELKSSFLAMGESAHISEFPDAHTLKKLAKEAGFTKVDVHTEPEVTYYNDVAGLIASLKGVGASNKQKDRKKKLTRDTFEQLAQVYAGKFSTSEGIPATWEGLYITGEKL